MAGTVTVVDVNGIKYDYPNTPPTTDTGGGGTTGGIWGTIVGAIPNVIAAIFPNGIGGNSNGNTTVSTLPNGNTQVAYNQSSSNIFLYLFLGAILFFTISPPIKTKR